MDKIEKSLQRLSSKERLIVAKIIKQLLAGTFTGLSIKKLRGHGNIFRIRKGRIRIIYRLDANGEIFILAIERRSEKTYDKF